MQAVVSSVSHSLVVLGSATKRSNGGNGGGGGVTLARPWGAVGAVELNGGSRKIAISSSFGARIIPVSVKSKLRFRVSALQQASESRVKWVLDPVGDGDTRHLDQPVAMPGAFELASDAVTVGRVAERADIVISVATVSGLHARLEKRDGQLYVTDLDSTNGTYVDDKRVRPGAVTPVFPGSYVTFGDEHLAVFRFSKVEEESEKPNEEAEA